MSDRDDKSLRVVPEVEEYVDAEGEKGGSAGDTDHDSATLGPMSRRERFRKRGIYLLPNLITTGALFAGFYAIVAGMNGNFIAASLAIFVAAALDTADGRVARLTNTESQFGAEYDSLSDMVAFGVAPALVGTHLRLRGHRQRGQLAAPHHPPPGGGRRNLPRGGAGQLPQAGRRGRSWGRSKPGAGAPGRV